MNVTIDSMKATPGSRAMWWFTLLGVVALGLALRLASIDRGTPGLGAFVYFGLLTVLAALIALPTSIACAFAWSLMAKFSWLEKVVVNRLWIATDTRARLITTICAALLTFAVCIASGRLPRWHVWMSVTLVNTLLTWRWFATALEAFRADAAARTAERIHSSALRGPTNDLRATSFTPPRGNTPRTVPNFASDDRRARAYWRGYESCKSAQN